MSEIVGYIKRMVEAEHTVSRRALLTSIVIQTLPSSYLDQIPLRMVTVDQTTVPTLILIDDVKLGVRLQVGIELPELIDDWFDRQLLVHREQWEFDSDDSQFSLIWQRELWNNYLIHPQRIQGKIIAQAFNAIDMMPPELDFKLRDRLFEYSCLFV